MFVVATDMDRTLLPNGKQKHDGSMKIFRKIMDQEKLLLIFVTGRRLKLLKEAVTKYKTPLPSYAVCDVGTTIYIIKGRRYFQDKGYRKIILSTTPHWNVEKFKSVLNSIKELKLQEKATQNEFKLSYYLYDIKIADKIVKETANKIRKICSDACIVYSVDETTKTGLLDILPKKATKVGALEYLRKKLKLRKTQIIYCGDSGNDIMPLTFGYKSILVRNAIPEVRASVERIKKDKGVSYLYIARGYKKLNGYYVSGVIEGLIKFRVIDAKYAS